MRGRIVVTKAGRPVAALVDITMFERLRKLDEEFDRMRGEIADAFVDTTEHEVEALTDEAVKEVRGHRDT